MKSLIFPDFTPFGSVAIQLKTEEPCTQTQQNCSQVFWYFPVVLCFFFTDWMCFWCEECTCSQTRQSNKCKSLIKLLNLLQSSHVSTFYSVLTFPVFRQLRKHFGIENVRKKVQTLSFSDSKRKS